MKTLLLSLICLLAQNYSAKAQEANYSFKESYKVTLPAQLVISSDDGNIEVLPSDQNSIEVYYIVKKNNVLLKRGRAEIEKEITLEVTSSSNSLKIGVKYPRRFEVNNGSTASLKIYVPKQTACNLETRDGNVSVSGLLSDQLIKTSDGNINALDIKGTVKGYTLDGDILIKGIQGTVDFKTDDGNVSLEDIAGNISSQTSDGNMTANKIKGNISLKTSDGDIELLAIEGSVTATTSEGNIRGNVNALQRKLSLETGDGNIDVTIPDHLGLDLDITGYSVQTVLKNFSGKSGRNSIQGQLNGGGIPIKLKASQQGNVNLSYR